MISMFPRKAFPVLIAAGMAFPGLAIAQTSPTATSPTTTRPAAPPATSAPAATTPGTVTMPPAATPAAKPRTRTAAKRAATPEDRVEQHIASLHKTLGITAAEEPQWNQFAQVMRDNATAMTQGFQDRATKISTMNAVDNMQSWAQISAQRAQDMQKLATAFQTLYATLTPAQQKAADDSFKATAERHK